MDNSNSFKGANLRHGDGTPNPLLKAAVESANDAIIITEAALELPGPRIEYVNPAFTRMTGYSAEEVIGQNPRLLQGPRTDRKLLERLREDLKNSRSFHGETINYRKDGSEYFVEWRITPLFGDEHEIVKWVAIQRDVTARVLAEQERDHLLESERAARTEAERQSRMKDDFLATLSHELRTPLNAIVGWSQILLSDRHVPDQLVDGLAVIERNARAQTQLIEDLLDMSRIITGQIRLDVQRVDLGQVIDAAISAVRHAAEARNVRLQKVIDPLAGPVSGDPNRLQQIVWNLLANAVKFTPAGGRVQVVLERADSSVEISVSDTGRGIKPEFLPHVFDRFRQQDSSTTRQHGGLGLGLAIVKHLAEQHGGRIRAKSPGEGQGATFTLTLPLSLHRAAEQDAPAPAAPEDPQAIDLKGIRVLVVDDDADSRELMHRLLQERHAEVVLAQSGIEAMQIFDEYPPTVLVSDIGMPGMDGYELIRHIRSKPSANGGTVPALAVTAFARSDDRRKAMVAGYDMHVSKPIDPAELLAIISRMATRH